MLAGSLLVFFTDSCSDSSLTQPRLTCIGMVLPTVGPSKSIVNQDNLLQTSHITLTRIPSRLPLSMVLESLGEGVTLIFCCSSFSKLVKGRIRILSLIMYGEC